MVAAGPARGAQPTAGGPVGVDDLRPKPRWQASGAGRPIPILARPRGTGGSGAEESPTVPGRPAPADVAGGTTRRGLDDRWTRAGRGAALPRPRCPRRA